MGGVAFWVVAGVLAAWTAATVVAALPPGRWLRRRDPLGLIPQWTFFAPNPGTHDYHLLWRDRLVGGLVTDWSEIELPRGRRGPIAVLWNPEKRANKALLDLVSSLLQLSAAGDVGNRRLGLQISTPYLALLNHVMSQPAAAATEARQFLVVESPGAADEADGLFLSDVHDI